ncbi:MAG TPA: TonB-dependent receptor [Opitutaceae bacterium]|nr:TonB-dependent receptor [Opitutaceae bacterium]
MNTCNHAFCNYKHYLLLTAFLAAKAALPGQTEPENPKPDDSKIVRLQDFEISAPRTSAQTMAPTESPLTTLQPQSSINLQTIQNSIAPTADYAMIANLAPSVSNFSTNGPGLNESKPILRGFSDGQYNVTFDGIPFGDGNDFTHHTTSYFPAKLIGREVIDRGPGTASTIGMATFGGTIAMFSKDPLTTPAFIPTLSDGSYHTQLAHFEFNTGLLPKANNASAIASYQYMTSDGYRTFGTLRRNTYFIKYLQPVGKQTTLTFLGTYNNIKFNNPNDANPTQQQIYTLGRNFGQTNNPLDANGDDYQRNHQEKHADMEYIGLDSDLGSGWNVHDKVYTFNYNNVSHESPNTNSGPSKKDFGGQVKVNVVRAYGDYLAVTHDDQIGTLKTGVWFDYQHGPRYNYFYDETNPAAGPVVQNNILDVNHAGSNHGYAWNMHYWTRTWQPYAEYEWHITPALSIDPGLKYLSVNRSMHGPVNQDKEVQPFSFDQTYSKALPLVSANYLITHDWSAYAQYAQGFLTPALAESSELNAQLNTVKPQQTTNYQLGTVYKTDRFNADIDGYWINYSNFPVQFLNPAEVPGSPNFDSNDLVYFNARGAYYYGMEGEATFYIGNGLSVFANGSRNYATYKGSKRRVENNPQSTAGAGLIYDHAGLFASFMGKYIGPYTVYSGAPSPDVPLPAGSFAAVQGGYTLWDLALGYGWKLPAGSFIHSVKIRLQVNDLFNRQVQLLKAPKANPLNSTYSVLTPRDYFLTVSGQF